MVLRLGFSTLAIMLSQVASLIRRPIRADLCRRERDRFARRSRCRSAGRAAMAAANSCQKQVAEDRSPVRFARWRPIARGGRDARACAPTWAAGDRPSGRCPVISIGRWRRCEVRRACGCWRGLVARDAPPGDDREEGRWKDRRHRSGALGGLSPSSDDAGHRERHCPIPAA